MVTSVRIGRVTVTVSPLLQVRFTGAHDGPAWAVTAAPFTCTEGAEHQPGIRR